MTILICGIVFFNPITHIAQRACVPVEMVRHRGFLPGDRRSPEA